MLQGYSPSCPTFVMDSVNMAVTTEWTQCLCLNKLALQEDVLAQAHFYWQFK